MVQKAISVVQKAMQSVKSTLLRSSMARARAQMLPPTQICPELVVLSLTQGATSNGVVAVQCLVVYSRSQLHRPHIVCPLGEGGS